MRIRHIKISNFLSFGESAEYIEFDEKLNVLVGSNGSGKTNILRAIELVRDVIERECYAYNSAEYQRIASSIENLAVPHMSVRAPSEIRLRVQFGERTEEPPGWSHECYLIQLFLRGIMWYAYTEQTMGNQVNPQFYTYNVIPDPLIESLRRGEIVVSHFRTIGSGWGLSYEFEHEGTTYRWALSQAAGVAEKYDLFVPSTGTQLTQIQYSDRITYAATSEISADVNFGSLLPKFGEKIGLSIGDQLSSDPVIRDELVRAGIVEVTPYRQRYGFERVLNRLLAEHLLADIDDHDIGKPVTTNMEVLSSLGNRALNVGKPSIPRYLELLFQWSTGDIVARNRYRYAQKVFKALRPDGSFPEISTRAVRAERTEQTSYQPQVNSLDAAQQPIRQIDKIVEYELTLIPMVIKGNREMPSYLAGSGVAELMRLSTYLAVDSSAIALLDEPAARLHPLAQSRLLEYLSTGDGQYFVVTHAPGLLPFGNQGIGKTLRVELDAQGFSHISGTLSPSSVTTPLEKLMRTQPEVSAIPFASAIVFVSGQTELSVLPVWHREWRERQEEQRTSNSTLAETLFVNFNGDNNFGNYLCLAAEFGISWVVIADGGSFEPTSTEDSRLKIPLIAKQINDTYKVHNKRPIEFPSDLDSVSSTDGTWFTNWNSLLEGSGVYTLANCWQKKKATNEECPDCKQIRRHITAPCGGESIHGLASHMESFEDFVSNDPELNSVGAAGIGQHKITEALSLLEQHPNCPEKISEIFEKIDSYLQGAGR